MDHHHFDALARAFASSHTRRGTLALLGSLLAVPLAEAGAKKKKKACPPCRGRKKGKCKKALSDGTACTGGACQGGVCVTSSPCAGGQKACDGKCIPADRCCTSADCGEGAACADGTCLCKQGFRPCQGACLADNRCCSDDDCEGRATCQAGTCVDPPHICLGKDVCLDFSTCHQEGAEVCQCWKEVITGNPFCGQSDGKQRPCNECLPGEICADVSAINCNGTASCVLPCPLPL